MESMLAVKSVDQFQNLLKELTGLDGTLNSDVTRALENVLDLLGHVDAIDSARVQSLFYGRINQKLAINRPAFSQLYATAAKAGVTFNYPTKKAIAWSIDSLDTEKFRTILSSAWPEFENYSISLNGLEACQPTQTKQAIQQEATKPSKLRKAHARRVVDDVLNAAAGPLVWSIWEPKALHQHFQGREAGSSHTGEYLHDLQLQSPSLFNRENSLAITLVDANDQAAVEYLELRERLTTWLAAEYDRMNNYGFVAVVIDVEGGRSAWRLACDLVLYGEHFIESRVKNTFFRWRQVERETTDHCPTVDSVKSRFDLANEGYTYRDQFVLIDQSGNQKRIALIMQKNQRDETPVPCPACRSSKIEGNSYPTLGVKSWECSNELCPERSIYNRGKRYSFKALLSQEAIEHPSNEIPVESVRRWQRDVLPFKGDGEILDTLIRHYSMVGDGVTLSNFPTRETETITATGRDLRQVRRDGPKPASESGFWSSGIFQRYSSPVPEQRHSEYLQLSPSSEWQVLTGDSLSVLATIQPNFFDRAITSPPYFNAREYSQWPNLYCYLHDMQAIAREVFRVLKPGAIYAYNIFDTFDNERTVAFSDMGRKRISLSAWTAEAFRQVGFVLRDNLVWDKGDIHGKRGFNAGNFSPFYQNPFNCWEHVLLFQKPGDDSESSSALLRDAGRVAKIHPVVKMVRGENRHGHTAPFPQELPARLLEGLSGGDIVLDPFGGSGTTARAALQANIRSVMIERDENYAALSCRLIEEYLRAMTHEPLFLY